LNKVKFDFNNYYFHYIVLFVGAESLSFGIIIIIVLFSLSCFPDKMDSMPIPVPLNHCPLTEILTPEEQDTLSQVVQQKLSQSINEIKRSLHNVTAKWQQEKVEYGNNN
jgi:hypothetical protein